jgi:CHAT domain-containing protein
LSTFYKEWTPDVDAATALLRAQENLRRSAKWRHPYYWAGWQLWGRP